MLCDFVYDRDGDRWLATCARCGRQARVKSRRAYAACRASEQQITPEELSAIVASGADPDGWKPLPLGDLVERGLRAIGITEERIKALTGASDCGCARRKSTMNLKGEQIQRAIREAAKTAAKAYFGE